MEETFKGEAKIIEKLKSEATKAFDKLQESEKQLKSICERLEGFGYTIDITTGQFVNTKIGLTTNGDITQKK